MTDISGLALAVINDNSRTCLYSDKVYLAKAALRQDAKAKLWLLWATRQARKEAALGREYTAVEILRSATEVAAYYAEHVKELEGEG